MMRRVIEVFLLAVIVCGGVLAWRTGAERTRLTAEYRRLTSKTGELNVEDPSRVYIRAIRTGDPKSFAWRVYVPPNYMVHLRHLGGGTGTSTNTRSQEFIARVRFREDEKGNLRVYSRFTGGSSVMNAGTQQLGDFMRDHWDQIRADQFAATGNASFDVGDSVVLLELTLSPEIEDQARKALSDDIAAPRLPSVFRLELGPEKPKP